MEQDRTNGQKTKFTPKAHRNSCQICQSNIRGNGSKAVSISSVTFPFEVKTVRLLVMLITCL